MASLPAEEDRLQALTELVEAARRSLEAGLPEAALVLLHVCVERAAAVARPAGKPDAQRSDYLEWVKRWLLPTLPSGIRPVDLYAERCRVLHSAGEPPRLLKEGGARPVCLAPETLLLALDRAIAAWWAVEQQTPERRALLLGRLRPSP